MKRRRHISVDDILYNIQLTCVIYYQHEYVYLFICIRPRRK